MVMLKNIPNEMVLRGNGKCFGRLEEEEEEEKEEEEQLSAWYCVTQSLLVICYVRKKFFVVGN